MISPHLAARALLLVQFLTVSPLAIHAADSSFPPVRQVVDLQTEFEFPYYWLAPAFAAVDETVLFTAFDGVHGLELWRTDGTTTGTRMVRDICPGVCSGIREQLLTRLGDRVYFEASDGVYGDELWVSDGTAIGTHRVADVVPGFAGSNPRWITAVGDRLFFVAATPDAGRELWITNGTEAGTRAVIDPSPGPGPSEIGLLSALDDQLLFFASDGSHGIELWRSDGTTAGTSMVVDLNPGPASAIPTIPPQSSINVPTLQPVVADGELFFPADDGVGGRELFATAGTAPTTRRIADLEPGPAGSSPESLTAHAHGLFFRATTSATGSELWSSSDGATPLVIDLYPGPESGAPRLLGIHDNRLLFFGNEPSIGLELWAHDIGSGQTTPVAELVAGPDGAYVSPFYPGIATEAGLFFPADDQVHGMEWWFTDGTSLGTRLTRDLSPGPLHSTGFYRTLGAPLPGGGALLSSQEAVFGLEPWRSDGTEVGTELLADINHQRSAFPPTVSWFLWVNLQAGASESLFVPSLPNEPLVPWR